MSTLSVPVSVPSPAEDCEQLRKAFQGWGTNEGLIISILAHRSAAQRHHIRDAYAQAYGEDFLKVLDKELTQDFEKAVLLWILDPPERDAVLANEVLKKWSPGNRALIEIAVTRTADEMLAVRRAYQGRFKRSPLLKTVFQVMMCLFSHRKTTLLFVIRDKTKTPLEHLEPVLREDIQKIWDTVPKPKAHEDTSLSEFFNVEVTALPSYEEKEEQFKEQAAQLRERFVHSIAPGGLAGDRRGVVPASRSSPWSACSSPVNFVSEHTCSPINKDKGERVLGT